MLLHMLKRKDMQEFLWQKWWWTPVTEAAIRERCMREDRKKDDNLALALAVGSILAENGVDVVYTRTDDSYETPFSEGPEGQSGRGGSFLSLFIEIPARKMTSTPVWRPWSTMSRG